MRTWMDIINENASTEELDVNKHLSLEEEFNQDIKNLSAIPAEFQLNTNESDLVSASLEECGIVMMASNLLTRGVSEEVLENVMGLEAQVVDVAKRAALKFKMVIKTFINAVINCFKKILNLGEKTDKVIKSVKKSAEAHIKKFDKGLAKKKLGDKDIKTNIKDLTVALGKIGNLIADDKSQLDTIKTAITSIETAIKTNTNPQLGFVNKTLFTNLSEDVKTAIGKLGDKPEDGKLKNVKEAVKEIIKDVSSEDLAPAAFIGNCKSGLSDIKAKCDAVLGYKLTKGLKDSIKNLEKIQKAILKINIEEDLDSAIEKKDATITNIIKFTTTTQMLPTETSMHYGGFVTLANKIITESVRALAK